MFDKQQVLDVVLQGIDLTQEDRPFARAFLSHLIDRVNQPDGMVMAIPVARRLMSAPGWRNRVTIEIVHAFCIERKEACKALRALSRTPTFDPEAEYLAGATMALASRLNLAAS